MGMGNSSSDTFPVTTKHSNVWIISIAIWKADKNKLSKTLSATAF